MCTNEKYCWLQFCVLEQTSIFLLVLQSRRLFCCPLASVAMQLALSGLDKPEYRPNIAIVVITIIVNAILIFFNTQPLIKIVIITITLIAQWSYASLVIDQIFVENLTLQLIASSSPIFAEIFSQYAVLFKKQLLSNLQELSSKHCISHTLKHSIILQGLEKCLLF